MLTRYCNGICVKITSLKIIKHHHNANDNNYHLHCSNYYIKLNLTSSAKQRSFIMGAQQYSINRKNIQDNYHQIHTEKAKVELPIILLEKLILSGALPGNECRCLDDAARKTLWQSLLQSSLQGEQSRCR
ncbi:MAG: hypothetical protein ACI971_001768 [Colwellia sp.]|jgi:hypothetical protein